MGNRPSHDRRSMTWHERLMQDLTIKLLLTALFTVGTMIYNKVDEMDSKIDSIGLEQAARTSIIVWSREHRKAVEAHLKSHEHASDHLVDKK